MKACDKQAWIASQMMDEMQKDDGSSSPNATLTHGSSPEARAKADSLKGQFFACMFQVDFPEQMELFHYIRQYEGGIFPQIAFILHDKDVYEDDGTHAEWDGEKSVEVPHLKGDLKKPHIHFVWKMRNRTTAQAMSKFLGGYWVEKVDSIEAKLAYLLHRTWESRHKHQYDFEELEGSPKLKDIVTAEKSNFVQLRAFVEMTEKGYTTAEIITEIEVLKSLTREEKNEYIAFILSHLGGLVTMQTQLWNKKYTLDKWYMAGHKQGYDDGKHYYEVLEEVGAVNV